MNVFIYLSIYKKNQMYLKSFASAHHLIRMSPGCKLPSVSLPLMTHPCHHTFTIGCWDMLRWMNLSSGTSTCPNNCLLPTCQPLTPPKYVKTDLRFLDSEFLVFTNKKYMSLALLSLADPSIAVRIDVYGKT